MTTFPGSSANVVVDDPNELTPAWLTAALQAGGQDLVLTSVESERIGTGQMGTTYRLQLTYDGPQGPQTLIAKLAGGDESMRTLVAPGYAAEIGFYTHLAPDLDVRTPQCWYGAIAEDNTRFTLLLDDAAPATPGVQAEGCTQAQARASLRNLVGLHTPRWSDASLRDYSFLLRPGEEMAEMMGQVMTSAVEGFVQRYEDELSATDAATLRDAATVIVDWQLARPEPYSVIHGDYRLDNLMFPPDGDDVVAVDWQTAAIGPPLRDVAYFLGTSVETAQRRASEEQLLAEYHAAIVAQGVTGYAANRCWEDYRLGQLQGPMVTVLGCIYASGVRTEQSDAMFLAMARRSCAAIRDLRSLDLL